MSDGKLSIASAQYDISLLNSWQDYAYKIKHWVSIAAQQGADILLFPEYASMELVALFSDAVKSSLPMQLIAMQDMHHKYMALYQELSIQYKVYILTGTFPLRLEDNSYRNRSYFFSPDGKFDYQDKLQMTRFENEHWKMSSGTEIKVFKTRFGVLGVNVCYDSEFPMLARQQVEMGANVILVPSCTDTLAGYYRVRIACQARALENQCFVVQSPTVGMAEWSLALDENRGAAAVYTPVDSGFPDNGVLVQGELDQAQWIYADLDLHSIDRVRRNGQVFNYRDWPAQFAYVK